MSTIKTTNITHGSNSGTANLVLASDGTISIAKNPRRVLEQFYTPCDGSTIATSAGNVTVEDEDDEQIMTQTYTDITGSSITYTPPSGTTQVIYEFNFVGGRGDDHPITHVKFYIDSDEVTDARTTHAADSLQGHFHFKWGINIGGSAVTATGRQSSWSSSKTLKMQGREYGSSNQSRLHNTYHWDGGQTFTFHRPCIGITAIG